MDKKLLLAQIVSSIVIPVHDWVVMSCDVTGSGVVPEKKALNSKSIRVKKSDVGGCAQDF